MPFWAKQKQLTGGSLQIVLQNSQKNTSVGVSSLIEMQAWGMEL